MLSKYTCFASRGAQRAARRLHTVTELKSMRDELADMGGSGRVALQLDVRGHAGIAALVLENDGKANALSCRMMAQLADCIDRLDDWPTGRAVILCGSRSRFCAGADLSSPSPAFFTPRVGRIMCAVMTDVTRRLRSLPFVSVAALDGPAVGGGAELAVSATFAVMSHASTLQFAHVHRNLVPGWGGITPLVDAVGRRYATWLLLSGSKLSASAAASFKLADSICDHPASPVSVDVSFARVRAGESEADDMIARAIHFLKAEARVLHDDSSAEQVRAMHVMKRAIDAVARDKDALDGADDVTQAAFAQVWGGQGHVRDVKLPVAVPGNS